MKIPTVKVLSVIRELETASIPLHCICINEDGKFEKYYLKSVLEEDEYCGLVYEIVCSKLASYMQINTPEISFALTGDVIQNNEKVQSNYLLSPTSICFASKEIDPHKMISEVDVITDKATFNKYLEPEQFIKIGLFDLWVAHTDRNGINYNLLTETSVGYTFYTIDHYHCFGGYKNFNKDFSTLRVNADLSILTSPFGVSFRKYLVNSPIYANIVEEFGKLDLQEVEKIIDEIFTQLPKEWKTDPHLQTTIVKLLTDKERNKKVIEVFNQLIYT